jgi:Protein of unknown function (DUF1360)
MLTHSVWWLVVDALAVYRLTVLTVRDTITAPLRERLRGMGWTQGTPSGPTPFPPGFHRPSRPRIPTSRPSLLPLARPAVARWLFELVTCPWCVSIWWAAGVVLLTRFVPGVWQYAAMGLALSATAGFLAER